MSYRGSYSYNVLSKIWTWEIRNDNNRLIDYGYCGRESDCTIVLRQRLAYFGVVAAEAAEWTDEALDRLIAAIKVVE